MPGGGCWFEVGGDGARYTVPSSRSGSRNGRRKPTVTRKIPNLSKIVDKRPKTTPIFPNLSPYIDETGSDDPVEHPCRGTFVEVMIPRPISQHAEKSYQALIQHKVVCDQVKWMGIGWGGVR